MYVPVPYGLGAWEGGMNATSTAAAAAKTPDQLIHHICVRNFFLSLMLFSEYMNGVRVILDYLTTAIQMACRDVVPFLP